MGSLCTVGRLLFFSVWHIGGFCSQEVHLCLFCMSNQMLLVPVGTARTVEKSLSFQARIGRNRQILLHASFFVAGLLVWVCGFFGHISRSISRNRLRSEFDFGLALDTHLSSRLKG